MVCGLLRRDAGEVEVAGRRLDDEPLAVKAAIGLVPQEIALYPDLTGQENLRFFGRLYGLAARRLTERVDCGLDVVGLLDRADERTDSYSGGMKRRLNIAAGLLHEPQLLVLDEPTVGVDPQSRNAILQSVHALGQQGMAILYTTHYMEEAQRLCDRVGIIDEGQLVAEGSQRGLVAKVGEQDRIRLTATGALGAYTQVAPGVPGRRRSDHGGQHGRARRRRRAAPAPRLLDLAADQHVVVQSVDIVEPDLEAVFLHLTGKALRD
jgi:ABC-2 type transport system ATP-binding protein